MGAKFRAYFFLAISGVAVMEWIIAAIAILCCVYSERRVSNQQKSKEMEIRPVRRIKTPN